MQLDVKLRGLANEDLVQGFPGVPATWPRLAGTVEIRSLPEHNQVLDKFEVNKVTISLYRTDIIVIPSIRPSMAAQKREQSFLVTRVKEIYIQGKVKEQLYALDVPFTLSLPTNKSPTASISISKMLESTYNVIIGVEFCGPHLTGSAHQRQVSNYQFPIRMKRFDTLGTFGTYKQKITGSQSSMDHLVSLEWVLDVSAFGPGDMIPIRLQCIANRDWPKAQKVKLKRFSVELVQKTKFFVSNEDNTQSVAAELDSKTRLAKVFKDFSSTEQDTKVGMENNITLEILVPFFGQYAEKENNSVFPKERPWIGYSGRTAFTNQSPLYKIDFSLVIKARLSHSKDIEAEQNITISQFNHASCLHYMGNLVEAAQRLKHLDLRPNPPRAWDEVLDDNVKIF